MTPNFANRLKLGVILVFALPALGRIVWLLVFNQFNPINGEYEKALGNGFSLVRANGSEVVICGSDQEIQGGNVQRYFADEQMVTGFDKRLHGDESESAKDGYFVLNKSTGEYVDELSRASWRERLKRGGVSEPELKEPPSGYWDSFWSL
ncbi:MAG: hypothetical protein AB7W16_15960 [Candidatus Obscuribacterales bacterium]